MKKMFCVLLTLSLIFCTAALATEYDESVSQATTTLTTTIEDPTQTTPTYTLIIPSTLVIEPNTTNTSLTVQLTETENANSITVITAKNGSMTNGDGGNIDYTVSGNELTFSNFNSLPSTKMMNLLITAEEWQQAPAGDYAGTMSFTISAE